MTRKEALAYLNFNEIQDDLDDHFETYLFKQKQFFISRPISKKIFDKQFEKIIKAQLAFKVLGLKSEHEILTNQEVHFSNEIKSNFNQYYRSKNNILQAILVAKSLESLITIAKYLLQIEKDYSDLWPNINLHLNNAQKIDPMNVLSDIRQLEKKGINHMSQFNPNDHKELIHLIAEISRLKQLNH